MCRPVNLQRKNKSANKSKKHLKKRGRWQGCSLQIICIYDTLIYTIHIYIYSYIYCMYNLYTVYDIPYMYHFSNGFWLLESAGSHLEEARDQGIRLWRRPPSGFSRITQDGRSAKIPNTRYFQKVRSAQIPKDAHFGPAKTFSGLMLVLAGPLKLLAGSKGRSFYCIFTVNMSNLVLAGF